MTTRVQAAADRLMDLSNEPHPDAGAIRAAIHELNAAEDEAADAQDMYESADLRAAE